MQDMSKEEQTFVHGGEKKVLNIYQRIQAVMREVDYIQKGDKKVNGQFRYASHDQVTSALHGPMTKHGIVCHPHEIQTNVDGNRLELQMVVRFVNVDVPEEFIDVPTIGWGIDNGDKHCGKALSYAMKYALLKVFMLETGEDADQDVLPHVPKEAVQLQEPPKPKTSFPSFNAKKS